MEFYLKIHYFLFDAQNDKGYYFFQTLRVTLKYNFDKFQNIYNGIKNSYVSIITDHTKFTEKDVKSKIIDESIAFVEVIDLLVSYYNKFYSQLNILTTELEIRGKDGDGDVVEEVDAVVNDEEGEEDEEDEDEENFVSIEEASEE